VVVLGGDGTTMQAAAALVGTNVSLGLVPGGTGNVLAGNLRLPRDPVQATRVILRGRSEPIDLGRLERADGVHYFGVGCGAGADARIMHETGAGAKRRWGIGGYFATLFRVLPEVRSTPCVITVDGHAFSFRAALVLVLNCGEMIPPLVRVRRGTVPTDGVLDVLALTADSVWGCARAAFRVFQNVMVGTGPTSYLAYARGRQVQIEAEAPMPVQYDGDLAGETPVAADVVPNAIQVMVP
jgi:diacylglycerol kinase (ATP)